MPCKLEPNLDCVEGRTLEPEEALGRRLDDEVLRRAPHDRQNNLEFKKESFQSLHKDNVFSNNYSL